MIPDWLPPFPRIEPKVRTPTPEAASATPSGMLCVRVCLCVSVRACDCARRGTNLNPVAGALLRLGIFATRRMIVECFCSH